MSRDTGLEELIAVDLAGIDSLTEKAMFGGWAWLINGNLVCGARADGMLVRLGAGRDGWALALPGIGPMLSRSKPMNGWLRAGPDAYGDDDLRRRLIAEALAFVRGLPPK